MHCLAVDIPHFFRNQRSTDSNIGINAGIILYPGDYSLNPPYALEEHADDADFKKIYADKTHSSLLLFLFPCQICVHLRSHLRHLRAL